MLANLNNISVDYNYLFFIIHCDVFICLIHINFCGKAWVTTVTISLLETGSEHS